MSECKTAWKYLKGSEIEFNGAFVGKQYAIKRISDGRTFFPDSIDDVDFDLYSLIGHREPITNVTVNISTPCGEDDLNDCIGQHHCREKVGELYMDGKLHSTYFDSTNCRCKPSDMTIQGIPINEISGTETVTYNKYLREIKPGVWVDVYDVLSAWGVTNPALQHLIKKALQMASVVTRLANRTCRTSLTAQSAQKNWSRNND